LFIGSGQQNKILEAMALGIPCLTTTLVNNAIGAQAGKQIFIADSVSDFAEQICQLLQQPAQLAEVAREAGEFVRERYDWQSVMREVDLPNISP
jgi:glycosyltransferase involved in cell wall biosynthesis